MTLTTVKNVDTCDCNTHHLSDFALGIDNVPEVTPPEIIEREDDRNQNIKVGVINLFVVLIIYIALRMIFCLF